MKFFIENINRSLSFSLNVMRWIGFLVPDELTKTQKMLWPFYAGFWAMLILGIYIMVQTSELIHVWGDLTLMTETSFLLLTYSVLVIKVLTVMTRRHVIQAVIDEADEELRSEDREEGRVIIERFDKETRQHQIMYCFLTLSTSVGWALSAEKGELPLRARYPYDISRSPAYELTYIYQVCTLFMAASLYIAMDVMIMALIAQCRCRLNLLALSLKTLCRDLDIGIQLILSPEQELVVNGRLRDCVVKHQRALTAAWVLQDSFSESTFAQFAVSLLIICVTAFQLISQTTNLVRLLSMGTYLMNMIFQVFVYCYQGNELSEESSSISCAAYSCRWYVFPGRVRRALLAVMVRARRVAQLSAGGFTTLSLATFITIIKASYSLFTLMKSVEEDE